jgi:glycosyltransferase involved in cell wall biosynthesis
MNVLIALTYYRPHYSGLTIYAEREARALIARSDHVTILTSRFDPSLKPKEMISGIQVIRPKVWFRASKGVVMPGMFIEAWRQVQKTNIVHLHVPQLDAAMIAILSKILHKPVVLTYHCDLQLPKGFIHWLANQVSNLANRITCSLADVIVTNTLDYARSSPYLRPHLDKLIPILPPVEVEPITAEDLQAFQEKHGLQSGQKIIGMAARLATEKGVEFLVDAMPAVLEQFPQARVLFVGPYKSVVGEQKYHERIMPTIRSLGDHWSFLGVVSPAEMTAFFKSSDVLVLPSLNRTESFGIVQVEAMSCRTPVIAADIPGVRVPISQTGSGLLVKPADAPALASAIIAVLQDPEKYRGQPDDLVGSSSPAVAAEKYDQIFKILQTGRFFKENLAKLRNERLS